jgi:hypothetical protein
MHFVKKAEYLEGYKIRVTFDNGESKEADLAPFLHGEIFEPLKDINYFKKFRLSPDIDTIYWENGADLAPEFLYEIGK